MTNWAYVEHRRHKIGQSNNKYPMLKVAKAEIEPNLFI